MRRSKDYLRKVEKYHRVRCKMNRRATKILEKKWEEQNKKRKSEGSLEKENIMRLWLAKSKTRILQRATWKGVGPLSSTLWKSLAAKFVSYLPESELGRFRSKTLEVNPYTPMQKAIVSAFPDRCLSARSLRVIKGRSDVNATTSAIWVELAGIQLKLLLDSGADINLISRKTLELVRAAMIRKFTSRKPIDITGLGGGKVVNEVVEMEVDLGGSKVIVEFFVVDALPVPLLAGVPFLQGMKAVSDFGQRTVYFSVEDKTIPLISVRHDVATQDVMNHTHRQREEIAMRASINTQLVGEKKDTMDVSDKTCQYKDMQNTKRVSKNDQVDDRDVSVMRASRKYEDFEKSEILEIQTQTGVTRHNSAPETVGTAADGGSKYCLTGNVQGRAELKCNSREHICTTQQCGRSLMKEQEKFRKILETF